MLALALNLAAGLKFGLSRPIESDAYYFLQLAQNLAVGNGYKVQDGFWPDAPSMRRLPGWPAVVAVALKATPSFDPSTVMRVLALMVNAAAAVATCAMTWRLFQRSLPAFLAGMGYACHPAGLYYSLNGFSEPLFVLLAAAGITCLLPASSMTRDPALTSAREERVAYSGPHVFSCRALTGGILLGCAALVRANFVLWSVIVLGLVLFLSTLRKGSLTQGRRWLPVVIAVFISLLPPLLWMHRNYRVSGTFPVLSSLKGQTFYGGNNAVVADTWEYWGYWVFPDQIPGETPMVELARTMTERDVDRYYYNKGKQYVSAHLVAHPKLLLGKLVRAYVPVPWHFSPGSVGVSLYRWLLYIGTLLGLIAARRRTAPLYGALVAAMLLANLFTVLMFWGCARFAFVIEPFLFPYAAAGVEWCGPIGRRLLKR